MTRTITLITATVGAALLFAVPAWGAADPAPRDEHAVDRERALGTMNEYTLSSDFYADGFAQALGVSVQNGGVSEATPRDEHAVDRERAVGTMNGVTLSSDFYADGFAQAVQSRNSRPEPVGDDQLRPDPRNTPAVTATSSGSEIEWTQIGIGFGIGLVLALGLYLAMRFTRIRPLAH
jgi:hypothetical protein